MRRIRTKEEVRLCNPRLKCLMVIGVAARKSPARKMNHARCSPQTVRLESVRYGGVHSVLRRTSEACKTRAENRAIRAGLL